MQRKARLILTALVLITGGPVVLTGCGDPCSNLLKTVCDCEPTRVDQQRCYQRIDLEAEVLPATDDQQQGCQDIVDAETCSCEALDEGKMKSCGLAN